MPARSPSRMAYSRVIGEPQRRWREMTHSRRFSTMPAMRCSPQEGVHFTFAIASRAPWRTSVVGRSSRTNHCTVARKMTGFLQRQQWGYSWRNFASSPTSAPAAFRSSTISGFASRTFLPLYFSTVV